MEVIPRLDRLPPQSAVVLEETEATMLMQNLEALVVEEETIHQFLLEQVEQELQVKVMLEDLEPIPHLTMVLVEVEGLAVQADLDGLMDLGLVVQDQTHTHLGLLLQALEFQDTMLAVVVLDLITVEPMVLEEQAAAVMELLAEPQVQEQLILALVVALQEMDQSEATADLELLFLDI